MQKPIQRTKEQEETYQHFSQKGMEIVNEYLLPVLLSKDLPVRDCYHITSRTRSILKEKFEKIGFSDPTILKLRKALFKSIIEEAKSRKVKKPKAEDKLGQEQMDRCEPVCRALADKLLAADLLLSADETLATMITDQERGLINDMIEVYMSHVDNWLITGMKFNEDKANRIKWDGKEPQEISWKDLDKVLQT